MTSDQTMRALADAATQGPWDVTDVPRVYAPCTEDGSLEPLGDFDHYADAEFIAAAREWVPDAIRRIERVRELHWGDASVGIHAHICAECRQEYPCPTIRALDGDK